MKEREREGGRWEGRAEGIAKIWKAGLGRDDGSGRQTRNEDSQPPLSFEEVLILSEGAQGLSEERSMSRA